MRAFLAVPTATTLLPTAHNLHLQPMVFHQRFPLWVIERLVCHPYHHHHRKVPVVAAIHTFHRLRSRSPHHRLVHPRIHTVLAQRQWKPRPPKSWEILTLLGRHSRWHTYNRSMPTISLLDPSNKSLWAGTRIISMNSRVVTIPILIIMTTLYTAKCTGLRKTKYMVNKSRQRRDLVKNLGSSRRKLKRPKILLTGSCGSWKINSGSAMTDPMIGATYTSGHP